MGARIYGCPLTGLEDPCRYDLCPLWMRREGGGHVCGVAAYVEGTTQAAFAAPIIELDGRDEGRD